mgnify:CR=1 FL=1
MALTDNLIAYYKLDGNSNDISGNDFNGSDKDISYDNAYGKINKGADFNGSSSKIALPTLTNLWSNQEITVCFWAKRDDFDNSEGIFYYGGDNANNSIAIRLLNTGKLWAFIDDTSSSFDFSLSSTSSIADNNYHFYSVVFTKNESSVATIKLYIDGSPDGSNTKNSMGTFNGTSYRWIGGYISGSSYSSVYDGKLDEIGIWNTELSSTDISTLYNSGTGLQYPFITDLTLAVDTMALALTYADVTLKKAIKLVVDTMALSFTFADVIFNNALTLIVDTMALSLTYADVTLKKAVKLVVDTMSLVLDFKNVILKKIGWTNDTKPSDTWTNDTKPSDTWTNDSK